MEASCHGPRAMSYETKQSCPAKLFRFQLEPALARVNAGALSVGRRATISNIKSLAATWEYWLFGLERVAKITHNKVELVKWL